MATTSAPHLDRDPASDAMLAPETIAAIVPTHAPKRWVPKHVLVTPAALAWEHGRAMVGRAEALGCDVVRLSANRLAGLRSDDIREQYVRSKATLAIVTSPPGQRKLQPIPPSADWQFHLAEGCPAHCQYCYLAGSLQGPPITRAYANLPEILDGLRAFVGKGTVTSRSRDRAAEGTTFEASCYTDPLGIEHLTHRFTPGSKDILTQWYPASTLEMDETQRAEKRTKFGSRKYVYPKNTMQSMRAFFTDAIAVRLPRARILYWT